MEIDSSFTILGFLGAGRGGSGADSVFKGFGDKDSCCSGGGIFRTRGGGRGGKGDVGRQELNDSGLRAGGRGGNGDVGLPVGITILEETGRFTA